MSKDGVQEKDQSMEEILQSIKRIIAEEGEEGGEAMPVEDSRVRGSNVLDLTEFEGSSGGRILDLTEPADEPASPSRISAPAAARSEPVSSNEAPKRDVLASIDSLLSEETLRTSSAALKALSEVQAPARGARDVTRVSPGFRHGGTVEDLVVEALKPMLKDWLDQNLSVIVREMVAKEIKKLSH